MGRLADWRERLSWTAPAEDASSTARIGRRECSEASQATRRRLAFVVGYKAIERFTRSIAAATWTAPRRPGALAPIARQPREARRGSQERGRPPRSPRRHVPSRSPKRGADRGRPRGGSPVELRSGRARMTRGQRRRGMLRSAVLSGSSRTSFTSADASPEKRVAPSAFAADLVEGAAQSIRVAVHPERFGHPAARRADHLALGDESVEGGAAAWRRAELGERVHSGPSRAAARPPRHVAGSDSGSDAGRRCRQFVPCTET